MPAKHTIDPELPDNLLSSNPAVTSRAARKLFLGIAQEWQLTTAEQCMLLGLEGDAALADWLRMAESPISRESLERISLLTGSYCALAALVPVGNQAHWVRTQNAAFNGEAPLKIILAKDIDGMTLVRTYLEAQLHSSP